MRKTKTRLVQYERKSNMAITTAAAEATVRTKPNDVEATLQTTAELR